MSSADVLALPSKLPEVEHWRDEPVALLPAALYALSDLADADLVQVQEACESKCDTHRRGECVRPPPGRWNFAGQTLETVVKHHLELAKGRLFNPLHFFIVGPSPSGAADAVLFVTLDADEEEEACVPDAFWVKAHDAGLCFMNVLIGSSDWFEQKEKHALKR